MHANQEAITNKKTVAVLIFTLSGEKNILSFSWECYNPIKTECSGIFMNFRNARSVTIFLRHWILSAGLVRTSWKNSNVLRYNWWSRGNFLKLL